MASNGKDVVIKDFPIGKRGDVLRVTAGEFKGVKRVDVRRYYEDDDGEKRPTQKGVSLPLSGEDWTAKDVAKAINEAIKSA